MSPVKNPEIAPDFTLPNTKGEIVSLSDYRGKYVLVNFWATWCAPCVKELPSMQQVYENLREDNFEILAVHAGPYELDITTFLSGREVTFEVLLDEATQVKGWDVPVLPVSYLIDPEGRLVYEALGPREWGTDAMKTIIGLN